MSTTGPSWRIATAVLISLSTACAPSPGSSEGGSTRGSGGRTDSWGSASAGGAGGRVESGGAVGSGGASATGGDTSKGSGGRSDTGGVAGNPGAHRPDAGAGASDAAVGEGQLTLTGLKIEANPKNVLSCFVSWKTSAAASSTVQFGVDKYEWEIVDANQVTEHKVLVIGMRAAKSYKVKAISTNSAGTGSAEDKFTTQALPSTVPVAQITAVDKTKMQPGWTLMNLQKGDGTATCRSKTPNHAVMYDEEGQPVWYYINGTTEERGGMVSVDLTDKGVLIGAIMNDAGATALSPKEIDLAGNTLWECKNALCGGSGTLTHHVGKLSNGHYIVLRDVTNSSGQSAPVFEELTSDNKVVWTLDYSKLVKPPSGATGDWCHGNSITVNVDKNEVYANCRWMGLIKTTYKDPNTLVWHLPATYGAKGLGNMTFSPTTSQYSDTHDPEIHDDGTIIFFDNGGFDGVVGEDSNPKGYKSRVVEYKIDEAQKTATLVWEFPGTFNVDAWYKSTFYLPFWGDADRLPNGNVLVTAGVRYTKIQSRIFEVTKQDGKVVWEFQLPLGYGVYRSDRITPPLVKPIGH